MTPDRYYGNVAKQYDQIRMSSSLRKKEQVAIEQLVIDGPVLDVPFGTGYFAHIYEKKKLEYVGVDKSGDMLIEAFRKHKDAKAFLGDIKKLPFEDGQFETAVCIRMFHWLYPPDMILAIKELRRVARQLVIHIRHGQEGVHSSITTYTHDLTKLYEAIDGLYVSDRVVISNNDAGITEIMKIREPTFDDVRLQFKWHNGGDSDANINKLSKIWTSRYGIKPIDISKGKVKAVYWTGKQLGDLLRFMTKYPPYENVKTGMITQLKPRHTNFPVTIFHSQGYYGFLDGRRRSNQWMHMKGKFPVLLVECDDDCIIKA